MKCSKCHFENPSDSKFCKECGTQLIPLKEVPVTETLETPEEKLITGSTFAGRYQIIEELGKGGMGKVYRALDKKLNEEVAIKLIKPEISSDKKTLERFSNELKLARKIVHRNVARMFDLNEEKGIHYITMEYVKGEDLRRLIRKMSQLSAGQAIPIAKKVGEGLAEAHRIGVVHRDLKPQNIMVDEEGNARILDFGIARSLKEKGITGAGVMIGTPEYMSPEQAEAKDVDKRSDIYSLGVILYEMVTGTVPFEGETPLSIAMKHKSEEPRDPRELNAQIPEDLSSVIVRCMQKDKEKRYQTAEELLSELSNIERSITTTERVLPKKKPEARIQKRRFQTFVVPGIILLVAVIIVAGYFYFSRVAKKEMPRKEPISEIKWRNSVGVLPFEDFSQQRDQGYFCDGMTDAIIEKLSKLGELKVSSRTSVMRYKDTEKDIKEIGEELGVVNILEGSIQKEKDKILVRAQLINVEDNFHIWSDHYEQKLESIFDIQNDIAQKIAAALKAELSPGEKEQLEKKPTENLTAYDYYLRGYEYYYRYKKQDNEHAIELFKQALELDPDFALAYAGLGDAYGQRVQRFGFPPAMLDEAIEFSKKAISIDPDCSEAYKALGLAYFTKGWLRESAKAYKKAVELNPNNVPAMGSLAINCMLIGELEEAMLWMKKALPLSPAWPYSYGIIGYIYCYLDDPAKTEEWSKRALELQPELDISNVSLIFCYIAQGKDQQAVEQSQKFLSISPNDFLALTWAGHTSLLADNYEQAKQYYQKANATIYLGYTYWKTGQEDEARKLFQKSLNLYQAQLEQGSELSTVPYEIATIYAIQGKKEEAYKWLQKAIDAGWRFVRQGLTDPLLENLHQEEQFKQMMAQVKEMVDEMRKRIEERD